jgi:hypothetical protein
LLCHVLLVLVEHANAPPSLPVHHTQLFQRRL